MTMSQQPETSEPTPTVTDAENNAQLKEIAGLSQGQIVRRRFFRHKGAVASMAVLTFVVILAFTSVGLSIGDWRVPGWWQWNWSQLAPVQNRTVPTMTLVPQFLGGPGINIGDHPFGQDEVGRDTFAVVMRGAQQSLMVMVIVGLVATTIGTVLGAVAGYYRGLTDSILMRFTDVIITIPVIVIGAVLGRAFGNFGAGVLGVVIGLFAWTGLARLVRGEFLSLREREFVDAARVAGASDTRIIFRHILPNAVGVIIVNTTLLMAAAILLETALSYLGFGVQSPDTSLGKIISDNQAAFSTRPWLFWWPGLFIVIIALCINFIGDGLRDAFDPRQKRLPGARALAKSAGLDRAAIVVTTRAQSRGDTAVPEPDKPDTPPTRDR
jgi:peptide/nickel transport system permease protein